MSRTIAGLLLVLVLNAGCDDQAMTHGADAEPEARDTALESLLLAEAAVLFAGLFAGLFAREDTRAASIAAIAAAPENVW